MEKLLDLLNRFSVIYHIPKWAVDSAAIAIFCILIISPFVAYYLMRPKYHNYREMFLFKVLWRWKYKKGDIISLWCYCPKCGGMLICDDENCRTTTQLQEKITFFVCNECGGDELGRVVGGDRRYALSLVRRDIWRHIKEGSYNDVSTATKEAIELYQQLEEEKKQQLEALIAQQEVVAPTENISGATHEETTVETEKEADTSTESLEETPVSGEATEEVTAEVCVVISDDSPKIEEKCAESVAAIDASSEQKPAVVEVKEEETPLTKDVVVEPVADETEKPLEEHRDTEESVTQQEDVKKDGI